MNPTPLIKGVAYHGNRMLTHTREDMRDLSASGFNAVLHMFSHNDWKRHKAVLKETFDISAEYGLDVWVDNWGLAGAPGDASHFLTYYPDAHQINCDGSRTNLVCYNSPDFVQFSKDWIDTVGEIGGKKLFWDEPHLQDRRVDGVRRFSCCCDRCKKLFEEHYGKPMPTIFTPEVDEFRKWSITNYFQTIATYAKERGLYNSVCVMPTEGENARDLGVDLDSICSAVALDNIGTDPYWLSTPTKGYVDVYKYIYERTRYALDLCAKHQKDHNIWIQTYSNPAGREEEIVAAADAMYDAGARTIFAWGYRGSDANDYRAHCPEATWYATKAAFDRITERWRNECRECARRDLGLE